MHLQYLRSLPQDPLLGQQEGKPFHSMRHMHEQVYQMNRPSN